MRTKFFYRVLYVIKAKVKRLDGKLKTTMNPLKKNVLTSFKW